MVRLFYVLIFLSAISTAYSLVSLSSNQTSLVALLPLTLLICLIVFIKLAFDLSKSFVFKLFLLQASIRYLLLPALYSSGQSTGRYSTYIEEAILVMVVELVLIFIIFLLFSKKYSLIITNSKLRISYLKGYVFIPLILILIFLYIYTSGATAKITLVWELDNFVDQYITNGETLDIDTLGILLFNTFKVIFILYLISCIKLTNKIKEKQKKWIIMLVIIGSGLFIVGVSRFSFLLNIAVLFALLPSILSEKDTKKIIFTSVPVIIGILIIATIAKFSSKSTELSSDSIITASTLNDYFAGFGNIAIGFDSYEKVKFNESILYFLNDTFQNVPLLSKLTLDEYKTTLKFNESIYGNNSWADQIVPLSVSGLFHFGYIGLFLYAPFFIAMALNMELLSYKVKFIGFKYVFLYLSVILSLVFMLNIGSFYTNLFSIFLFIFIPLFFIKLINSLKFSMR